MMNILIKVAGWGLVCAILATARSANAAGFALIEQSVKGQGNAFAGAAATAEDASTIFYNPAGLTELSGFQFQAGGHLIIPSAKFQNAGSTFATGAPIPGSNGGDAGTAGFVPNLYAAWDLGDRVKVGIGANVPFGLQTEYDADWVGRYQGIKSKLLTININPTIAAKLSDQFSIGAGVNLQYAKAELTNAVDFGLIGAQALRGTPLAAGLRPGVADGLIEVEGDDWSWGFNLGALYKPATGTKIGLAYRSAITHKLQGNADFSVPASLAALTSRGSFTDTSVVAPLKTPDTLSLSASQKLGDKFTLLGDVTWTNWSRFEELRLDFANPAQPAIVQPENWQDTYRWSVGLNYQASQALLLRAGFAVDPTPVRDGFRTVRIPDGDRTWLSIGATYQPSPKFEMDFGYTHIFVEDVTVSEVNATAGTVRGDVESAVNILSAQLRWRF
jgi:long-chain fatty acid transport protein